jgi:hypothetical protein
MINEHDITKLILDKIRSSKLLREFEEPTQPEDEKVETQKIKEISFIDSNGDLSPNIPENMKSYWDGDQSEKRKFMDGVSPNVSFSNFTITPKTSSFEGDVSLIGTLNDFGIGFSMNKKQDLGLRITTTPPQSTPDTADQDILAGNVKVTPELIKLITKLNGYYQNWYKEWATKLNTENFGNNN